MTAPPALDETNPFDPALLRDPWDYYRRMCLEAPVHKDKHTGITFIASYAAVEEVVRDWETFSNRFGVALGGGRPSAEVADVAKDGYPPVDTMLTADPPEQRRFRKLVNKAFTVRRVERLEKRVTEIASELVDRFAGAGRCDLLRDFSQPLPLTVIAEQLGAPREHLARFRTWTDAFVAQLSGMADAEAQKRSAQLILEFQHYFAARLEERRAEPQDDILSDLVHATVEDERSLDVAESLSILQQLLVAGNETTSAAITEGVWLLLQHPEQLALVREDPARIPNLVEEVLRLSSPTSNMWRVCTKDTEIEGVEIPAGAICMVRYAAANRDPRKFPDPDRFDITRANAEEHLAFGLGIHFCIGAQLARKEMVVGFRTLLERLDDVRLAPGATPEHAPNVLLRGLTGLPIEFTPRA